MLYILVEEKVGHYNNIHIFKNNENLGFSSGNNVGYKYARNKVDADYVAILNNDIIVDSRDFIEHIVTLYETNRYHLTGPDVESLIDHKHQNPMKINLPDTKKVKLEIWRYRLLYLLSRLNIYDLLKGEGPIKDKKGPLCETLNYIKEGAMLHGSFVIFSLDFIKNEEYSFRPGTFLYMEEANFYSFC